MRFLLALSSLLLVSEGILNGHSDEWNKYAHLVKILARSSPNSPAIACSGTLLSPAVVLTGADCVMQEGKKVKEIMVLVARASKAALRKRAVIAEVNGTLAYLKLVHPMGNDEVCPGYVSTDLRVARLSISPSLTRSPLTPFDWEKIGSTTCRILAFESMENVDDFLSSTTIQTAVMKVEVEKDGLIVRRVDTAVPAPCFEDAGAPFECLVENQFIQVGLFSSLYSADDGKEHRVEKEKEHRVKDELRFKRDEKEVKEDTTTTTTTSPVPTNAPKKDDEKEDTTTTPEPTNAHKKEEEKADTTTTPEPTNAPKKEDKETFSRCLNASTLRFSRLEIESVASFIEKNDFSRFVKMHEDCGLMQ